MVTTAADHSGGGGGAVRPPVVVRACEAKAEDDKDVGGGTAAMDWICGMGRICTMKCVRAHTMVMQDVVATHTYSIPSTVVDAMAATAGRSS